MKLKVDTYLDDELAQKDLLGYEPYVKAITNLLLASELKTPFTIGLYGNWGSGKSTLMNLIKQKIEKEKRRTVFPVWFTPWLYQDEDNLLIPLFLTVLKEAKESPSLKRRISDIDRWAKKTISVAAEPLLDLIAKPLLTSVSEIRKIGKRHEEEKDISLSAAFNNVHFLNRLRDDFEALVKSILTEDGKLVVFIDDLDRCRPEKAIEMLEAIKLFLGVNRCVFIIGMNYDVISLAIRNKYGEHNSKRKRQEIDVEEYLEKIVQLPFRIPVLRAQAIESFISAVEHDPEICKLKYFFAEFLPKNPRKVKKVLNIFRLTVKLARFSKNYHSVNNKKDIKLLLLAKIIVMRERWLSFYSSIEADTQSLKKFEQKPSEHLYQNIKDRNDLIRMFEFGTYRFSDEKDLSLYFSLTDTTSAMEQKVEVAQAEDSSDGNASLAEDSPK